MPLRSPWLVVLAFRKGLRVGLRLTQAAPGDSRREEHIYLLKEKAQQYFQSDELPIVP